MKNNLFRKFLAVFLTGTMLAGVGCKDYDDDIDKINDRLDGMDVTVADLQTQITNVKNSIPTLDELNSKVTALTSDLAGVKSDITSINSKITAIGDVQAKLNALKSDLQAYVNGQIQSSEETLRKEIATKATASDIEKAVAALKAEFTPQLTSIENSIKALEGADAPKDFTGDIQSLKDRLDKLDGTNGEVNALKDRLAALEGIDNYITTANLAEEINKLTTAPSWLGDAITTAIQAYQFPYATASEATDATIKSLLEKMGYANQDYKESLIDLIKKNTFSQEQLNQTIQDYVDDITPLIQALEQRTFELEGRIQSMVWVPASLAEANEGILFETSQFITLQGKKGPKTIVLGTQEASKATIRMRVSPAKAIEKIEKAWNKDKKVISIVVEQIKMTRADAAAPTFNTDNVVFDAENGTFTVTASTDYKFGSVANETLAIAVNVKIANENKVGEGETAVDAQGIDFTSAFIGCNYDSEIGELTADDFVVAYTNEKEEVIEYDGTAPYKTELQYNKEGETVTFFDNFAVYYKTTVDKTVTYTKVDGDLWGGALESVLVAPDAEKGSATVNPKTNEKSYKLTNVSAMILSGKSSTDLINDEISSDKFSFILTDASNKDFTLSILSGDNVKQTVKIAPVNTKLELKDAEKFTWKYGQTEYATKEISVGGTLSAKVYNELKNTSGKIVLLGKDKDGKDIVIEEVSDIKIEYTTTPSEDGDAQKLKLTITDNQNVFIANGVYTVQADYALADQTTVTVLIPVTVTGMPQIATFEIPAKEFTYDGSLTYTLLEPTQSDITAGKDVADLIWEACSEQQPLNGFFTKEQFTDMLKAATVEQNDAQDDNKKVLASLENNNFESIDVTFANTDEATYTPGLTFTNGKIVVKVTSTVTMKKPVVELVKNDKYFADGKIEVNTTLSSDGYKVNQLQLSGAYSKSAGTPEAAEIVYALNYTDKELEAMKKQLAKELGKTEAEVTMPKVENNIIDWGDYNKRTLKLKVSIVLNGTVLGTSVECQASIADPIKDTRISQMTEKKDGKDQLKEAILDGSKPSELSIAGYLVLNDINNENVYDPANAAINTVLNGKSKYGVDKDPDKAVANGLVKLDEETGLVTFTPSGGAKLQEPMSITFKVSYTYKFDEGKAKEGTITVTVKAAE